MKTTTAAHKFTIKGFKSFMGREGHGFNARLFMDGALVAFIMDDASGGCFRYDDKGPAWDAFKAYVAALPKDKSPETLKLFPDGWKRNMDAVVTDIVLAFEEEKQMRGWCKTKVCFRLHGDKVGTWRTIKAPYEPRVKAHIVNTHGAKLEEILNERFV